MKRFLKITLFLIVFLLILSALLLAAQYKVIRVVDGDTIVVDYEGKYEKVRLLCVNTPESVHPDKKQNMPMGKAASDYTKKRLKGKFPHKFRSRKARIHTVFLKSLFLCFWRGI